MSKEVATIWLTNYCNMDCTYCYENKKKHEKMSGYKAREVIKFIKKRIEVNRLSEYIIRFHGGEPLLNAEAIQIFLRELKSVKKCKIRYYITTNGTLYNEKIEKILVHMDEISISIDGNKKIHDQQRIDKNGNGTFDLVIKNYEKIKQVNQNTSIRMTITPNNIDFLFESIKELEFHYRIKRFIPQIDFTAKWNEEHYDSLILQFTRIKKYILGKDIYISLIEQKPNKRGKCTGGEDTIQIDCNGIIYPCLMAVGRKEFIIGDIKEGIREFWKRKLEHINQKRNSECIGCSYIDYCINTRCKIINYILTNQSNKVNENFCMYENLRYYLMTKNFMNEKI